MPIEFQELLEAPLHSDAGLEIGRSRAGRPISAFRLGSGPRRLSLIGGCHADEPVGPALLRRLVAALQRKAADHPAWADFQWWVVPHANPDGQSANASWTRELDELSGHPGDFAFDPVAFLERAVRELPGDDIEFGFPRGAGDPLVRPENLAIRDWWRRSGGFGLHASLHGMAVASGAWFLVERDWIDRLDDFMRELVSRSRSLAVPLFDVDRRGEKGFHRVAPGFSTRPDSRAMRDHFQGLSDPETASKFRPSSMETVRAMGTDPLTLVSEMPLFLRPGENTGEPESDSFREGWRCRWRQWQVEASGRADRRELSQEIAEAGVRAMRVVDQWRLQWAMIEAGIKAAFGAPK